jgi:heat shock protein HslJ
MTHTRIRNLLLVPAIVMTAAVTLGGCGSTSSPSTKAAPSSTVGSTDLAGTSWLLESYTAADGSTAEATKGAEAGSLTFGADATFSGSTGCNRIAGTFTQDGSSLTMQPGPMTAKACAGAAAAQETAVVAALPQVASFTAAGALVLLDADGATLLTYAPGLAELAGTSWRATGINNGKEAVVAEAGTELVTAQFNADGTVSGSGGCNTYSATYTTPAPGEITFGPVASTKKACPEAETQIEQNYFTALENATVYQIDGTTLTLRDADGATQVSYTSEG